MEKFPSDQSKRERIIGATESQYRDELGLDLKSLIGKKVLDIGAEDGAFAAAARRLGVEVTSLDINRTNWQAFNMGIKEKGQFVQGDAEALPFADQSFDVIVSRSTDPFEEDHEAVFREAYRVLKSGGEFHLGPNLINPDKEGKIDPSKPDIKKGYLARKLKRLRGKNMRPVADKGDVEFQNIRHARARAFLDTLRGKVPFEIVEFRRHKRNREGFAHYHYILRKPLAFADETRK